MGLVRAKKKLTLQVMREFLPERIEWSTLLRGLLDHVGDRISMIVRVRLFQFEMRIDALVRKESPGSVFGVRGY